MTDLAALLGGLVVGGVVVVLVVLLLVVGRRRMVILGLGVALGLDVLGLIPGGPLHGFGCRHCLVDSSPIGSRGYATGFEFVAHLSRAGGFSQQVATIQCQFRRCSAAAGGVLAVVVLLSRSGFPCFFFCALCVGRGSCVVRFAKQSFGFVDSTPRPEGCARWRGSIRDLVLLKLVATGSSLRAA